MNQSGFRQVIDLQRRRIQSMNGFHPIARARMTRNLQALEEAERDILNIAVTGFNVTTGVADKNNFRTYAEQVSAAYEMYEARGDYGAELFGSVVDMRASFIGGEGISVVTKNKAAEKWTADFLADNKLNGSRLIDIILTGELEGRNLLTLAISGKDTGLERDKGAKYIAVEEVLWYAKRYQVTENGQRFEKATYKSESKDVTVNPGDSAYIVLGKRLWSDHNSTPGRLHKVITDFQNFSRAKYDLRNNTHLFGKVMPNFKTKDAGDAAAVNKLLSEKDGWKIGDAFVGPAEFGLKEPTGAAGKSVESDALLALKLISSASGIPMHWLAWPELMSNRATAENLMEVVNAATARERLVWEEGLRELILKAMIMAAEKTGAGNGIIDPDIKVMLPFTSVALQKQTSEIMGADLDRKLISKKTYVAAVYPGSIDYETEKTIIDKEDEEAAEKSPMKNGALEEALKNIRDGQGELKQGQQQTQEQIKAFRKRLKAWNPEQPRDEAGRFGEGGGGGGVSNDNLKKKINVSLEDINSLDVKDEESINAFVDKIAESEMRKEYVKLAKEDNPERFSNGFNEFYENNDLNDDLDDDELFRSTLREQLSVVEEGRHWGSADEENRVAISTALINNGGNYTPINELGNPDYNSQSDYLNMENVITGIQMKNYVNERIGNFPREDFPEVYRGMMLSENDIENINSGSMADIRLTGASAFTFHRDVAEHYTQSEWTSEKSSGNVPVLLRVGRTEDFDNRIGMWHDSYEETARPSNKIPPYEILNGSGRMRITGIQKISSGGKDYYEITGVTQ
jgi:hypothetical protein